MSLRIVHITTIHSALDVRIFAKECRTLANSGYDVHLICQNPPAPFLDGVTLWDLEIPSSADKVGRFLWRYRQAYRYAFRLQGNIYHFHDPELIVLGLFLKARGFQVIYDVHEDTPREALALNRTNPLLGWLKFCLWHFLETLARLFLDAFVCVTPTIKDKFPANKSWLVHNFPLLEESSDVRQGALPYIKRPNRVVYAGNITKIRGIEEMIDAMARLSVALECQLFLLGTFSPGTLEAQMENKTGWTSVDFRGWQPRSLLEEYFGQARVGLVTLHPERIYVESIPNKLFEYMAAGLPVVASDFPAWRELIGTLECGLVVNPLDSKAIADAIHYLLENPELAERMGQNGQWAVQQGYNWEAEAQTLLQLYETMGKKALSRRRR